MDSESGSCGAGAKQTFKGSFSGTNVQGRLPWIDDRPLSLPRVAPSPSCNFLLHAARRERVPEQDSNRRDSCCSSRALCPLLSAKDEKPLLNPNPPAAFEREREPSLWCPDLEHTKTHDTLWLRHQRTPPFWSATRTGCNGTRDSTMGQFFMEQTKLAKEHELFHSMKSCLIVLSLQRYVPRQDNRRRLLWSFSNKYSFKKQVF